MSKRTPLSVERVAALVAAPPKYAAIDRELIEGIAAVEAPKAAGEADAVKRVKRKLHQLVGAYLDARLPFEAWLADLRASEGADRLDLCRHILAHHASTKERLADLDAFYATIFGDLAPRTVLDLACGMNPLARPFMPLADDALYIAVDVHRPLVAFLGKALALLGGPSEVATRDLIAGAPPIEADVALLLKALPCLEQADKAAPRRLLETIAAPVIVVSYPTASLGGARRGMGAFYEGQFRKLASPDAFAVERFEFASELVFRLTRR